MFCQNINKIKFSDVVLAWVPSHVGRAGNDEADTLAKDGLKIEEINGTAYLEGKEMNRVIRDEILIKKMADGVRPREKGTLLQKHRAPGIDSYQIHRLYPESGKYKYPG